jgi:hypothetical protein
MIRIKLYFNLTILNYNREYENKLEVKHIHINDWKFIQYVN